MNSIAAGEIKALQTVYVVYDKNLGIEEPYCNTPNQIEIASGPDYSMWSIQKEGAELALEAFQQEEFIEYLKRMEEKGVSRICYWKKLQGANGFMAEYTKVKTVLSSD